MKNKCRFAPGASAGLTKKQKDHTKKWAEDLLRNFNMAEKSIPFSNFEVTGTGIIRKKTT